MKVIVIESECQYMPVGMIFEAVPVIGGFEIIDPEDDEFPWQADLDLQVRFSTQYPTKFEVCNENHQ